MCGCTPTHAHRGQRGSWEILLYHTLGQGLSQIWSLTSFKKGPVMLLPLPLHLSRTGAIDCAPAMCMGSTDLKSVSLFLNGFYLFYF